MPSSPEDLTVSARKGAPGHPLLEPLSAACLLISFISYNTTSVGSLGLLLCLGTGAIGGWGFWAVSILLFRSGIRLTIEIPVYILPDTVCWFLTHLTKDRSRQADVAVPLRQQGSRILAEETVEEGAGCAVEGSLNL